jgi:hypothetical protein
MTPGVRNFPSASMTVAFAGVETVDPISAIFPSLRRTEPPSIRSPVPVKMVAFRMTVVSEGKGR